MIRLTSVYTRGAQSTVHTKTVWLLPAPGMMVTGLEGQGDGARSRVALGRELWLRVRETPEEVAALVESWVRIHGR